MKKLFYILILFLFIAGCTPYRELLETKSTNGKPTDNGFVYENDTLKVTYYFWAEDGVMKMSIYNKLNVPIFIDWKISNFIDNGHNLQYWYDIEHSTSVSNGINYYGLQPLTGIPVSAKSGVTKTSTEHPDRITSITPHSDIKKAAYTLISKGNHIDTGYYNSDNSPIKFRSYLAFALDESFTQKFFIDNQFYVSHAEFIKEKKFEYPNGETMGIFLDRSPYKNPMFFYTEQISP